MLAITLTDGRTVETAGVFPVAPLAEGHYVGEDDVSVMFPGLELMDDDEGNASMIVTPEGAAQGTLDDDGYLVWSAASLPGVVTVAEVDARDII